VSRRTTEARSNRPKGRCDDLHHLRPGRDDDNLRPPRTATLPEAAWWDQLHRIDGALVAHQRQAAEPIYRALEADAPGHRLTLEARLRLAHYDASPLDRANALERLLQLFPDDENLHLSRLAALRELARRDERLATFRELCAKPKPSPVFWQQYAQELVSDARERPTAIRLLRRAIRFMPLVAGNYYVLAGALWDERRFAESLELYRLAVCLDDKDEYLARSYFTASRHFRATDAALEFLRSRFQRLGNKSSLPARTLFWALDVTERHAEAFRRRRRVGDANGQTGRSPRHVPGRPGSPARDRAAAQRRPGGRPGPAPCVPPRGPLHRIAARRTGWRTVASRRAVSALTPLVACRLSRADFMENHD